MEIVTLIFFDSDYEVEARDDDLFADNVDTLKDEDSNLRKDEHENLKYNFRAFNPQVDKFNPRGVIDNNFLKWAWPSMV